MQDKEINQIRLTDNYRLFSFIKGNRKIDENHKNRIKTAIEAKNLLDIAPIIVNEKMEVIDGQHRLKAAEELEFPVPYIVKPGLTEADIQFLNTNSKGWTMSDFVRSYADLGIASYKRVADFAERNDLSIAVSLFLLGGRIIGRGENGERHRQRIRAGKFRVQGEPEAIRFVGRLDEYKAAGLSFTRSRGFISALRYVEGLDNFIHENMLAKVQQYPRDLRRASSKTNYIIQMFELYNRDEDATNRIDIV